MSKKPVVWAVIPARYGSTRFPGKPLVSLAGKPLLAWVIDAAKQAKLVEHVAVATDDIRIQNLAQEMGVEAIMTNSDIHSGTDRIWAAVGSRESDIILNIQGDEPLATGSLIDSLVKPIVDDSAVEMATLAHPISIEEMQSPHSVKVITNVKNEAIYFSRFAIPYSRELPSGSITGALKHIGMYAFRTKFLEKFCKQAPVELEKLESLEQLRALYLGARIQVIKTDYRARGVDTPADIPLIEKILTRGSL